MNDCRLDRVFLFADQLSFLIPHEWIEADDQETDHYLYHSSNANSGWFRVSLITAKGNASKEDLFEHLSERAEKEHGTLNEFGENFVAAWEQLSREDGDDICNYWWAVAHSRGPALAHQALFSYTVLLERNQDPETIETVALLGKLVSDARFQAPKNA